MEPTFFHSYRIDHENTFLQFMQRQEVEVTITNFIDPSNFYIRPIIFNKFVKVIEDIPNTQIYFPKLFELVIIVSNGVNKRAQVIDILRGRLCYEVFTLDYGELLTVAITNIRKMPEIFSKMSTMCIHCSTHLIIPREGEEWSDKAIDIMKDMVTKRKLPIIMETWRGNVAEVQFLPPHDVIKTLLFTDFASWDIYQKADITPNYSNYPKPAKRYYSHHTFQVGDRIKVKFLGRDPKLGFYVTLADSNPFTDKYDATKYKPVTWSVFTQYCAVYKTRNDRLYRAIVNDIMPHNKFELRLVDSGKLFSANACNIYEGPNYVFEQNAMAIYCVTFDELFGMDCLESDFYFVEDFEFTITVDNLGDGFEKPHEVSLSVHR